MARSSVATPAWTRFGALAAAVGMLAVAGWVFNAYILFFGFPDGFSSELGRAENAMAIGFCWASLALAALALGLFWRSFFAPIGRLLVVSLGLYAVVTVGLVVLDMHFRTYMMDDAGG